MEVSSASSARLLARTKGREKPQLSCSFCRKRKLRCDRKKPCESCIRLGQAAACSFPVLQLSPNLRDGWTDPATRNTFQERIDQLESLVRSLSGQQQDNTTSSTLADILPSEAATVAGDRDPLTHDFGSIHLHEHESSYVESDHWTAILDEISDLKAMAREHIDKPHNENRDEPPQRLPGADLFLFQTSSTTKMEIIAAIPPRHIVDSIIAKYFKTADMPVNLVIHRRVFFKQYEGFWEDPVCTPVMWITILFGMMFIVAHFALFVNGGPDSLDEETQAEYQTIVMISREKMIQCLRIGNYMKGAPHTIEALLSFLQTEYMQGEDTQQGCWQLMGVIVRIALKMGYHRDGSHFPELSVYESEMRRRIWYLLTQFDTASASLVGLPRMIKQAQCDTAEPRNLLDNDFDDTTTVLPPARPHTDHTLSQFLVYKSRVMSVYGMICDFTTSSNQRNYDEAMNLDKMLNTAYAQKPPILELKPMHRSIMDGTDLITRRLYLAMGFHHAQMTLHRKFMIFAKTNAKYAFSHAICIDAAFTVLRHQADLFEQCQPGRMLYVDRWKVLSLIQSEFLLATTILCLNLHDDMTNARWPKSPLSSSEIYRKSVSALQSSLVIWKQQQEVSKEAQTGVKAINFVLTRAQSTAELNTPDLMSATPLSTSSLRAGSSATTPVTTSGIGQEENITSKAPESYTNGTFTHAPPSSSFYPSEPQDYSSSSVLSGLQADFNDGTWGELFEMDQSWDSWLQI